jgi:hypothetical protein
MDDPENQNLMRPEHRDWSTFRSFLRGAIGLHGCDGTMKQATGLMIWLGADWFDSCRRFEDNGALCDCQILVTEPDEPRPQPDELIPHPLIPPHNRHET